MYTHTYNLWFSFLSFLASMHSAATPLGSLLSGILMERYGRKLALQLASIPLVIGWILIALSPGCVLLLIGRLTAGVSVGLIAAPGQVTKPPPLTRRAGLN